MKTFRAADGRRVTVTMTAEEIADRMLVRVMTVVMPVLTITVFALAAGIL